MQTERFPETFVFLLLHVTQRTQCTNQAIPYRLYYIFINTHFLNITIFSLNMNRSVFETELHEVETEFIHFTSTGSFNGLYESTLLLNAKFPVDLNVLFNRWFNLRLP